MAPVSAYHFVVHVAPVEGRLSAVAEVWAAMQ